MASIVEEFRAWQLPQQRRHRQAWYASIGVDLLLPLPRSHHGGELGWGRDDKNVIINLHSRPK